MQKLLELADIAWEEVLIEKIKDHIRQNDQKIDNIAKVVAETNKARWKEKMARKTWPMHYAEQLKACLCEACEKR